MMVLISKPNKDGSTKQENYDRTKRSDAEN